jgi:cell division protein ZapA
MPEKPQNVQVEIFGYSYSMRAGTDPGYVKDLAAYVDTQMREIARAGGAVDSVRIAVLAAMNIADELFQAKNAQTLARADIEKDLQTRAATLAKQLSSALGEG